jgi:GNAT superfamily N-acetyltransferase
MQLELAIVEACSGAGCRVRYLQETLEQDTRYSSQILHYGVEIRPGDLVVVDRTTVPPRTVFCFARTQIERVEIKVHTDRHPRPQEPIGDLEALLLPGEWVFATVGQVYDRCVDGLPADPERMWAEARPMVESLVQPDQPAPQAAPAHPACVSAPPHIEYLTAETERGQQALQIVMERSYHAGYQGVPPEWSLVRLVDGVPVSFIVVQPELELDMRAGEIPYAFVNDVATRQDRRREGHFRALMEQTYERLRQAGYSLVLLHGRYPLYRPLGYAVFTHHSGIFLTPEQIERVLGAAGGGAEQSMLQVEDHRSIQPDLLLVTNVQADSRDACARALRAAAALAREKDKARILFEHPPAPCGKRYQVYDSPETLLSALARTCGAEVRLQGADPEGGAIPDADWIKVLDAAAFVSQTLDLRPEEAGLSFRPELGGLRRSGGSLALDTDAGVVTLSVSDTQVTAQEGILPGAMVLSWPSAALAQLVTGYRSPQTLALLHGIALPPEADALLSALFPTCWRFSRNESWTFCS